MLIPHGSFLGVTVPPGASRWQRTRLETCSNESTTEGGGEARRSGPFLEKVVVFFFLDFRLSVPFSKPGSPLLLATLIVKNFLLGFFFFKSRFKKMKTLCCSPLVHSASRPVDSQDEHVKNQLSSFSWCEDSGCELGCHGPCDVAPVVVF